MRHILEGGRGNLAPTNRLLLKINCLFNCWFYYKNRFRLQIRIDRLFFTHQEIIETEGITYSGDFLWDGNFAPMTIGIGYTRTF